MDAHFLIFEQQLLSKQNQWKKGETNVCENLENCKMNSTINDLDHEVSIFHDPKKTSTKYGRVQLLINNFFL